MAVKDAGQDDLALDFVQFSVDSGALRFGEFKTKAGRLSPYFFNAGLFDDGAKLGRLAQFYAQRILASGIGFDMIFGPAYKGIPLAAATAIELARLGRNVPYAYNRKEAKDHGEGGTLVGAPVKGKVLIIDDVMSAGTAARESIAIIEAAGATPHAVAIALDRQEKATENGLDVDHSAVQYVRDQLGLQVCAIARLADLLQYLERSSNAGLGAYHEQVLEFRQRYGVEKGLIVPGLPGLAVTAGWLLGGLLGQACAQSIYTCVDAKGRRLTADREIAECADREQKELSPGGLLKRRIGPSLTALERAQEEEKARKALEERNRLAEEKRRFAALLVRFPDRATHDKERSESLAQANQAIAAANQRTADLLAQRQSLNAELEFFKSDAAKAPPKLKRRMEENEQHVQAQKRFVATQEAEKQRINARFDEEQAKLSQLWVQRAAGAAGSAAATAAMPAPVKP